MKSREKTRQVRENLSEQFERTKRRKALFPKMTVLS